MFAEFELLLLLLKWLLCVAKLAAVKVVKADVACWIAPATGGGDDDGRGCMFSLIVIVNPEGPGLQPFPQYRYSCPSDCHQHHCRHSHHNHGNHRRHGNLNINIHGKTKARVHANVHGKEKVLAWPHPCRHALQHHAWACLEPCQYTLQRAKH